VSDQVTFVTSDGREIHATSTFGLDYGSRTEQDAACYELAHRPDREPLDVDPGEDGRPLSAEERARLVREVAFWQAAGA
jgi:hypothetical protein